MAEVERAKVNDGIEARQVAFSLLNSIFIQKRSLDDALVSDDKSFNKLSSRDRAFVRLLIAVVLKHAREIDNLLRNFLHEPLEELKPGSLINIFRLGIAQFAFLKTAAYAAVNTTVDLAEAEGFSRQKSLVNAIMRRLTREGFPQIDKRDAGKINTPKWLWNEWMKDYGVEIALQIVAANFDTAPLDISVKKDAQEWAKTIKADILPTGSLRKVGAGFIPDIEGFSEGYWWVQNAASALPAKLFGGDIKGKRILDLCAAPGGKTSQLISAGASVVAVDRSAKRLAILEQNMQRLNMNLETIVADGSVWQACELFDAVLLDAPCTATGTIRHQPDILHLKELKDQVKLAELQKRLIENAVKLLKPEGVLIYCTCSIQKAEGEDQYDWAIRDNLPLKPYPIRADEIDGISEMLTPRGEIRALPYHWEEFGGIDGFYIARFIKL